MNIWQETSVGLRLSNLNLHLAAVALLAVRREFKIKMDGDAIRLEQMNPLATDLLALAAALSEASGITKNRELILASGKALNGANATLMLGGNMRDVTGALSMQMLASQAVGTGAGAGAKK